MKLNIVKQVEQLWKAMQDLKNCKVKMTHDGYLKLYQLSKPKLLGYDALLIDEAQDCNPAALDIFKRQEHMPKMFVGDGYQQIYSFRGAINALDRIPSTKTFYLTKSFRFGPEIANIANLWMRTILGEEKKFLIGTDKPSRLDGVVEGQLGVICRSNVTVFKECVRIAMEHEGRRCLWTGTFDFESLEALFYLHLSTEWPDLLPARSDHWILQRKEFETLEDVKLYADKIRDMELLSKVLVVEKHGPETGNRIRAIKSCLVKDTKVADFVVTTAHKSKGLEFDTVRLAEDLDEQLEGDDKNLIYVAMTRAKKSLILNEGVYNMLTVLSGPLCSSVYHPGGNETSRIMRRFEMMDEKIFM